MFNDSQARYVMAVFGGVRRHLDHIETVIDNRHPDDGEYKWDLGAADIKAYRKDIEDIRNMIDDIVKEFEIPPVSSRISGHWTITTSFDFAEVELEELSLSTLKGYGEGMERDFYDRFNERMRELRQRIVDSVRYRPHG